MKHLFAFLGLLVGTITYADNAISKPDILFIVGHGIGYADAGIHG